MKYYGTKNNKDYGFYLENFDNAIEITDEYWSELLEAQNNGKIIIPFENNVIAVNENEYSFENEKFEETLKMNIKEQLKITNIPVESVETLKITPIKAKKVIIKFYEKQIECSTGSFALEGDIELLNYLYKAGMGSKHSAGFGMFQIV